MDDLSSVVNRKAATVVDSHPLDVEQRLTSLQYAVLAILWDIGRPIGFDSVPLFPVSKLMTEDTGTSLVSARLSEMDEIGLDPDNAVLGFRVMGESQGPDLNRRFAALQAAALGRTLPPWRDCTLPGDGFMGSDPGSKPN